MHKKKKKKKPSFINENIYTLKKSKAAGEIAVAIIPILKSRFTSSEAFDCSIPIANNRPFIAI